MTHQDTLQRFILEDIDSRGELVYLGDSLNTILQQHAYPAFIRQFLGETLLAAVLLRAIIKMQGVLTIQLQTEGAMRLLVAKCDTDYHIRGLAQWDNEASPVELQQALGNGKLIVTVMPDNQVNPYQSIIPLQQQTITKALEDYFLQSEQLATKLWLEVNDDQAMGVLLQKLPSSEMQLDEESLLSLDKFNAISHAEKLTLSPEELLPKLFDKNQIRLFAPQQISFQCTCSVKKMAGHILLLDKAEAEEILQTHSHITVTCEFCNQQHPFDKNDVEKIFAGSFTEH